MSAKAPNRASSRARHLLFWSLLFVVFPLATAPKTLLSLFPDDFVTFPEDGFAEVLLPKLVVFALFWTLGARTVYKLWREGRIAPLSAASPLRGPLRWLSLFLLASLLVSLVHPSSLGLSLPLIGRYESVLFRLLETAWYALTFIGAGMVASRVLPPEVPLHLMALGACSAGLWTLLEAYGIDPMRLVDPQSQVGINLQATMGHQSYVAAFVSTVLVFWVSWRLLLAKLRALDVGIIALLTAALVASGGRAGLLAALLTLSVFIVYWLRRSKRPKYLLVLGGVMLLVGAVTVSTSPHAQDRLQRLGVAAQGEDPATSHRLIFWQVGLKAILQRPLTGYGVDAFGNAAWWFASPEQADEMLTEFLPPRKAEKTVRIGKLAVYRSPDSQELEVQAVEPYRVHNYLLDIAFASGIPVLLLFLLFVASSLRALYRAKTALSLATSLALLTYLLYGMAWFATPNVDPLMWGLVGIGLGSVVTDKTQVWQLRQNGSRRGGFHTVRDAVT
jgi:O-antigen ligase